MSLIVIASFVAYHNFLIRSTEIFKLKSS